MNISDIAKFLETHSGRDKILRTMCYTTKFASGVASSSDAAAKFERFSSQMSACRAILRLFDDIPMLHCTLTYGLGKQEKDRVIRLIDVVSNVIDQAFFPIEHIAWAAENEYIKLKDNPWSTTSTVFWIISIYLSLMRAVRCFTVLQYHKRCLKGVDCDVSSALPHMEQQQYQYVLATLRHVLDLVHAVNCLPDGYLWGGKLLRWQVGAIGSLSSFIGLYMALQKKKNC